MQTAGQKSWFCSSVHYTPHSACVLECSVVSQTTRQSFHFTCVVVFESIECFLFQKEIALGRKQKPLCCSDLSILNFSEMADNSWGLERQGRIGSGISRPRWDGARWEPHPDVIVRTLAPSCECSVGYYRNRNQKDLNRHRFLLHFL